jgi:hypothetical protein
MGAGGPVFRLALLLLSRRSLGEGGRDRGNLSQSAKVDAAVKARFFLPKFQKNS